jgi:hypothetical protein
MTLSKGSAVYERLDRLTVLLLLLLSQEPSPNLHEAHKTNMLG